MGDILFIGGDQAHDLRSGAYLAERRSMRGRAGAAISLSLKTSRTDTSG